MLRLAARTTTVVVGFAALVVTGAGVATATAHLTSNVISACVGDKTGAVRIPTTGTCKVGETKLEWNRQGPPAPVAEGGIIAKAFSLDPVTRPLWPAEPTTVDLASTTVTVPAGKRQLLEIVGEFTHSLDAEGLACTSGRTEAGGVVRVDGQIVGGSGTTHYVENTYVDDSNYSYRIAATLGTPIALDEGSHVISFALRDGHCEGGSEALSGDGTATATFDDVRFSVRDAGSFPAP